MLRVILSLAKHTFSEISEIREQELLCEISSECFEIKDTRRGVRDLSSASPKVIGGCLVSLLEVGMRRGSLMRMCGV